MKKNILMVSVIIAALGGAAAFSLGDESNHQTGAEYCAQFQADDGKPLVYIEGKLKNHFARPDVVVDCFPIPKQTENGIEYVQQKCPEVPWVLTMNLQNSNSSVSVDGVAPVISFTERSKAESFQESLKDGNTYGICGVIRPADHEYIIPVLKGKLSSLKEF